VAIPVAAVDVAPLVDVAIPVAAVDVAPPVDVATPVDVALPVDAIQSIPSGIAMLLSWIPAHRFRHS